MLAFHRERVREGEATWHRIVVDHLTSAAAEHVRAVRQQPRVVEPNGGSSSMIGQDVHFALRSLARRPLFAAIVISTIALGVGANAAIFSVVNGILLRPLPYANPDRVVTLGQTPPTWLAVNARVPRLQARRAVVRLVRGVHPERRESRDA